MARSSSHADAQGSTPSEAQDRTRNKHALALVLALTATFTVVEIVGGLLTGSLALLADAVHMLSDNVSLGLALFAVWLAQRPATPERSFGYKRAEIVAALANAVALIAISIWIFVEAIRRFSDPPEVLGDWMLLVAALGLAANLAGMAILWPTQRENLNVKAAFRHILSDLLGSMGTVAAALAILLTGWLAADPLISVLIGILIVVSSWSILREALNILLEAAPAGIDAEQVGRAMVTGEGVIEVHDLHIWTITSGFPALSAHVLVSAGHDCHEHRRRLEQLLAEKFGITHSTLQVDHATDKSELLGVEDLRPRRTS